MRINSKLELLSLVVFNRSLDATVFRVVQIDKLAVGVIDTTYPHASIQWVDKSSILLPSIGQVARFTEAQS